MKNEWYRVATVTSSYVNVRIEPKDKAKIIDRVARNGRYLSYGESEDHNWELLIGDKGSVGYVNRSFLVKDDSPKDIMLTFTREEIKRAIEWLQKQIEPG